MVVHRELQRQSKFAVFYERKVGRFLPKMAHDDGAFLPLLKVAKSERGADAAGLEVCHFEFESQYPAFGPAKKAY